MATLADVERFVSEQFQAFHRYLDDLHVAFHNQLTEAKQELRSQVAAGQVPNLTEQPHPLGRGLVAAGPTPGVTEDSGSDTAGSGAASDESSSSSKS